LRPWWQRFLIVLAGPIANFLLAIVIFSAFFMAYELPNTPPVAAAIARGSAAERAGLRAGDRILAVGSHSIDSFEDLRRTVSIRPNHEVTVEYARGGHEHHIMVTIGRETRKDEFGQSYDVGLLGLQPPPTRLERKSLVEAIPAGVGATANMTRLIVDILGQIVTESALPRKLAGRFAWPRSPGSAQATAGPILSTCWRPSP
jgi:regulator of sigma E protease